MKVRFIATGALLVAFIVPVSAQDTHGWNELLEAHVSSGRVDYVALAKPAQRKKLEQVIVSYGKMPASAGLADWLNAYNASVVWGVVQRYPIKSVMDVNGFFKKQKFHIAGKDRTLDEMEHKLIRPRFEDARVHAALNCAAVSCPPLHGHAFKQATLEATLEALTRRWLDKDVQVAGEVLKVSELFFWFADDFERESGSVRKWIAKHAPRRKAEVEATSKLAKIPYDWRLNGKR